MSGEYVDMWKGLGIDIVAHDMLLQALGKAYGDIFLSQKNRPEGMKYFDFVVSQVHGLRIREILEEKERGNIVVGTFCVYVPEELVLSVGGVQIGLCAGADMGFERAEEHLPRNTCALIKSFVGFKLRACARIPRPPPSWSGRPPATGRRRPTRYSRISRTSTSWRSRR